MERFANREHAPPIRAERLIAAGRAALAAFSLLAIWLDPTEPARYERIAHLLLTLYAVYALALALVVWSSHELRFRLGLVTHVLDLAVFTLFMYFTEGPSSPFFAYFTFAIVAATLRWQWRGTVWTAVAVVVAFDAMGLYAAKVIHDPAFELNRFIIRSAYLAVATTLLGYLGAYEQRRQGELANLAAWPRAVPRDAALLLREVLESAARVLDAPRALLVWEEREEPWVNVTLWADGEVRSLREAPEAFHPVVAEPLAGMSFLAADAAAPAPLVLRASPAGIETWRGAPLHPELRSRFVITAVLGMPLVGECHEGYLFALDKHRMTADDIALGEVVARQTAASLDLFFLSARLRQAAAMEERVRLSRDLHDGLLQSLTGTALQLQTVRQLLNTAPQAARQRLVEIQHLIAEEQRDLRFFVHELRPTGLSPAAGAGHLTLEHRLRELVRRLQGVWGESLEVTLQLEGLDAEMPEGVGHEIYRLVQEALVNAARHADATAVHVAIGRRDGQLSIIVADNGRGFPFRGKYDHDTLIARRLGPLTLKERVAALRGTLAIESSDAGARLEMHVPLAHAGA